MKTKKLGKLKLKKETVVNLGNIKGGAPGDLPSITCDRICQDKSARCDHTATESYNLNECDSYICAGSDPSYCISQCTCNTICSCNSVCICG